MATTEKKITKREQAIQRFADNIQHESFLKEENLHGYIIFTYVNKNNKPVIAIFGPRGSKPESYYNFQNEENASKYLNEQRTSIIKRFEQEQKNLKQFAEEKKGFEAGKILVSSWGCEQTNIDFYLILERKNDFVLIQEIGEKREFGSLDDRGTTIADPKIKKGEPFKKKIDKYANIKLNSYQRARLWDEKPEYWSSYA